MGMSEPHRTVLKQIPGKIIENTAKYPGDADPGQHLEQFPTSNLAPPYGYSHLLHIYLQITGAFCPSSRTFINRGNGVGKCSIKVPSNPFYDYLKL